MDLRKVNLSVLRPWIAQKVTELIKIEDDVVVEYAFGMLEDRDNPVGPFAASGYEQGLTPLSQIPDPRKMQISLVGFMDKHGAAAFMEGLWPLLLSAQATVGGVPAAVCPDYRAACREALTGLGGAVHRGEKGRVGAEAGSG